MKNHEKMKSQLTSTQDSLELIVSILVGDDDAKKGEKITIYKCSQQKSLQKKKDDESGDGGNKGENSKRRYKDANLIKSDGKASDKRTIHEQGSNKGGKKRMKNLMIKLLFQLRVKRRSCYQSLIQSLTTREKGITIKEFDSSKINKPKTRSQINSEAAQEDKGNGIIDKPPTLLVKIVPKFPKVTIDSSM